MHHAMWRCPYTVCWIIAMDWGGVRNKITHWIVFPSLFLLGSWDMMLFVIWDGDLRLD